MTRSEHDPWRPSIADAYRDLLAPLNPAYRDSLILRLTHGYYEGWRPTRPALMALIAAETGLPTGAIYAAGVEPTTTRRSGKASGPTIPGTRPSPTRVTAATATRRTPGPGRGTKTQSHRVIAEFDVDCGELAPGFRFIAHSLSTAGMTTRGSHLCRLTFLNYVLQPMTNRAGQPRPTLPMIFSALIICVPDHRVPGSTKDGKERQHTVENNGITGRRGPWPLAEAVQRVSFAINRQTPAGIPPPQNPVGILRVVLDTGRAAWRAVEQEPRAQGPTVKTGAFAGAPAAPFGPNAPTPSRD